MALKIRNASLAMVLFLLAGVLSYRTGMGQMALYIHPRYELLVYVCAGFLVLFGAVQWHSDTAPARLGVTFALVPLCIAVAFVPKPLGASALTGQLATLNTVAQAQPAASTPADPAQWNLYEWAVASSIDITDYDGSLAAFEGFVVVNPDLGLPANQVMVARYVLKCCTADAGGVGMRVVWGGAPGLRSDTWVLVRGTMSIDRSDGPPRPLLVADSVTPIEQPARPYLVP
jgi:putative membrane protein